MSCCRLFASPAREVRTSIRNRRRAKLSKVSKQMTPDFVIFGVICFWGNDCSQPKVPRLSRGQFRPTAGSRGQVRAVAGCSLRQGDKNINQKRARKNNCPLLGGSCFWSKTTVPFWGVVVLEQRGAPRCSKRVIRRPRLVLSIAC